jgi:cyclopropane fatty-acyl-phospholipid synthase-like methyltransferase
MSDYSQGVHRAIVAAYPFTGIETLCDVGGGQGALLAMILQSSPSLSGVLFDQPHVTGPAQDRFAKAGVAARARVENGSFFDRVPQGADAYILSHIIHDWDDERSAMILSRCAKAMAKGGRVLLSEIVIPGRNEPSFGKGLDFEMLISTPGGRERTEEEFRALFAKAGLKLSRIVPTPAHVSVIEGVAG